MTSGILEQLLDLLRDANANKELWDQTAALYKNTFDALVRAGFSEEQAITIVSRQGTGFKS